MANLFLISDTHFTHEAICHFTNNDGTQLRPWDSAIAMDEFMVTQWNSVVRPQDPVYHLGDVVMRWQHLEILKSLNGHKRLVRGNHDIFPTRKYLDAGFKEIYGVRVFEDMILSHIPLHPDCISSRFRINVHGHLHNNVLDSPLHFNICVERMNYTPIALEDLRLILDKHIEKYNAIQTP